MPNIIHLNNTAQSQIYRLVEIDRKMVKTGFHVTAVLYQSGQSIQVSWSSNTCPDIRLKSGVIVSPRGACTMVVDGSAIQISRLVLLERPEASLNLFDTIGHDADSTLLSFVRLIRIAGTSVFLSFSELK